MGLVLFLRLRMDVRPRRAEGAQKDREGQRPEQQGMGRRFHGTREVKIA
jgi:hypothetical protein